jgi:TPR repeat protein
VCHALHPLVKSSFVLSVWALPAVLLMGASFGCAAEPLVLSPLPAAPAACPIEGCAAAANKNAARASSRDDADGCGSPAATSGVVCAGSTTEDCVSRAMARWEQLSQSEPLEPSERGERSSGPLGCIARMFSEACNAGDLRACGFAGRLWLDGRGVAHDAQSIQRGLAMLTRACDGGLVVSCTVGAHWLARRDGAADSAGDGPSDKSDDATTDQADDGQMLKARLELEQACLSGQADACFQVGQAFEGGNEGFPRDASLAATEYARGCDLEDARACNSVGCALEYGDGVPRDSARANDAFERSCHLGESTGCANVGYMAEHGEGTSKDWTRARALYRDACRAGEFYGCVHADMLAAVEAGAPGDFAQALPHWERLCNVARSARACEFASILYLDGVDGGQRDPAKSLSAMARACSLGEPRACLWVKSSSSEE